MVLNLLKQRIGAFRYYFIILVALALAFYLGHLSAEFAEQQLRQEVVHLKHSRENLTVENNRLTRDLNILGVDLEVARLAAEQNRKQFQQQMEVEQELRQELSFYQKVMAPELEQDGFMIDSFNVEPTGSNGFFRYAMILMQQDKHRTTVKGSLEVTFVGSLDGKPKEIPLSTLMSDSSDELQFSFRYFEVINGELLLPSGFQPELIVVESRLKGKKWGRDFLKRTFDWRLNLDS